MVGLGGTAEKLQKVASMAEDVYKRLNEMRRELNAMRQTVERVDDQTTQNRALLEAIAEQQGIDVDSVLARTAIEEAEPTGGNATGDGEPASGADDGATDGTANGSSAGETTSDETTSTETADSGTADADGGTTDGSTTGSTDSS